MQVCIYFEVKTAAEKTLCWPKLITKCEIKQTSSGITKPVFMTRYQNVQNWKKKHAFVSEHCFTHRAKLSGELIMDFFLKTKQFACAREHPQSLRGSALQHFLYSVSCKSHHSTSPLHSWCKHLQASIKSDKMSARALLANALVAQGSHQPMAGP